MKVLTLFLMLAAVAQSAAARSQDVGDYQISGIVVDHLTNHPLNHVLVQIVKTTKGGGSASALTEADGRFVFTHVPLGKYQLIAEKRGQTPQAFESHAGYSTAIVVDGKQKTDGIIFAMRTDASINGTVLGDDGEPVRHAMVFLLHETVNDGEPQTFQEKQAGTNSAGQFHLGHLQPGRYYLAVQATPWFNQGGRPGNNMSEVVYPITFYGDTTDGTAARAIVLPEGGSADAQINLHLAPAIHVKLPDRDRGVGLFVPGPGGSRIPAPVNFANMQFHPPGSPGPRPLPTPEDSSAPAELTNLAAGRYEVTTYGNGRMGGTATAVHMVDLVNGSTLTSDPPAYASITGSVIFDTPRPPGDVELFLGGGQRGFMAEVAADGTFKFDKPAAGNFALHLNTGDLVITSVTVRGARMVHDNLEVPAGAAVELAIHASATETLANLQGVATRDGAPFPGAMVLLLPQDLARARLIRRDQSDSDGSFSLTGVQPGRYTLLAIDDGTDIAYKNEAAIKPYLQNGVALTIPQKSAEPVTVPVQTNLTASTAR